MKYPHLVTAHALMDRERPESYVTAANYVLSLDENNKERVKTVEQGVAVMQMALQNLLDNERYMASALLCWGVSRFDPRPRNVKLVWGALMNSNKVLAIGHGSGGKCLGVDTPVMKADGSVVPVQRIVTGDMLGGPSGPRRVMQLYRGRVEMAEIIPVVGERWTCTRNHIMTLASLSGHGLEDVRLDRYLSDLKGNESNRHLVRVDQAGESELIGFRAEMLDGLSDYYGFELDGDRRFYLGDGTITHNTYNGICWILLDWARDPLYTNSKIISTTEGHAKSNAWSKIVAFHKNSAIPLPGHVGADIIYIDAKNRDAAIALATVPQGPDSKARLQGFHPVPRAEPHPIFGRASRVRALMDEAEKIASGIWIGIDNMLGNEDEAGSVKVFGATNPEDQQSPFAQRAEPVGGWRVFDLDTSEQWTSAQGYHVVRLDGARCENVVAKKIIYPGLLTYDGYMNLERRGLNDAHYLCVDERTEVLSSRGWISHKDLRVGTDIYTLNPTTGRSEWKLVQEVFAREFNGELMSMEGRGFSALVTKNHRWAVTNKDRKKRHPNFVIKQTDELARHDLIPLAAPIAETGKPSRYSVDVARLVGWVVTDGTVPKQSRKITVYQSRTANPKKCADIRMLLERLGASWNEWVSSKDIIHFQIKGELAGTVRKIVGARKKLTIRFIRSLDLNARRGLLDALVAGDGGDNSGVRYVCTNNEHQAGVYAALMALIGSGSHICKRIIDTQYKTGSVMYYVDERKSMFTRRQYIEMNSVPYSGVVWCPRTDNQTFLARRNGGVYFTGNTMARGAYPVIGATYNIWPSYIFDDIRGVYTFSKIIADIASLDPAFAEGGDNAVLTKGRYGLAIGFQPMEGDYIDFSHAPKFAIQAEQQFNIEKGKSTAMAKDIIATLRMLHVRPEWFVMDRSGNALGLYHILCDEFGDVLGLEWGAAATDKKVFAEDKTTAEEQFDGLVSELQFVAAQWAEFGFLKILPLVQTSPLFSQLQNRKYRPVSDGLLRRVESKIVYKLNNAGQSPDEGDSLIMLPHLVRMRGETNTAMLEKNTVQRGADVSTFGIQPSEWDRLRAPAPAAHGVKFVKVK